MINIPVIKNEFDFSVTVALNGVDFTIRLRWLERQEAWYASLYDIDGNSMYLNSRLSVGYPLFLGMELDGEPTGPFLCIDSDGDITEPTTDSLWDGKTKIVFFEIDDLVDVVAVLESSTTDTITVEMMD